MHRPLIPILLSYLCGIIIGYYITIPRVILLSSIFVLLAFFIITIAIKKKRLSPILPIIIFNLLGILFINNNLSPQLLSNHIINYAEEEKIVIEGVLYRPPKFSLNKTRLYLLTEKIIEDDKLTPIYGKLLLTVKDIPEFFD